MPKRNREEEHEASSQTQRSGRGGDRKSGLTAEEKMKKKQEVQAAKAVAEEKLKASYELAARIMILKAEERAIKDLKKAADKVSKDSRKALVKAAKNAASEASKAEKCAKRADMKAKKKAANKAAKAAAARRSEILAQLYPGKVEAFKEAKKKAKIMDAWVKQKQCKLSSYPFYRLGNMYESGDGVVQNYKKALVWFLKAVDLPKVGRRPSPVFGWPTLEK